MRRQRLYETGADGLPPIFHENLRITPRMKPEERQRCIDRRTEILATILAAYPTTSANRIAKRLQLCCEGVDFVAAEHGVSHDDSYLNADPTTRRPMFGIRASKAVEKVDADGHVVCTYPSINSAAAAEGISYNVIKSRVDGRYTTPVGGYYYRRAPIQHDKAPRRRSSAFDLKPFSLADLADIEDEADDDYGL